MSGITISGFTGISPRTSPALLANNAAQSAKDVKLYSGELRSWRQAKRVATLENTAETIYRFPDNGVWLSWENDVDVVPGPIVDTDEYPIYYTGDGVPKKTNVTLATSAGDGAYPRQFLNLGVPAPTTAPTVTQTGPDTGDLETRVYVYTNVSEFGSIEEESAPSPPSTVASVYADNAVSIADFSDIPDGAYNITKRRIYRTVTGSATTTYLFVAEISTSATSYTDNVAPADLGEELPSLNYAEPPANLEGLVSHPAGFLAGYVGNSVRFSEPFALHAFPLDYEIVLPFKVRGLGVVGQTIFAMTDGNPYALIGADPSVITPEKLPNFEPCVSKASIATNDMGLAYASPNGLVLISPGGTSVVTQTYMTRDEWQEFRPATMEGQFYDGVYFGFYEDAFNVDQTLIVDPKAVGGSPVSTSILKASATYIENGTAKLFYAFGNEVFEWEGEAFSNRPYEWKSKLFVVPRPLNFTCAQIDADYGGFRLLAGIQEQIEELTSSNATLLGTGDVNGDFAGIAFNTQELNGSDLEYMPGELGNFFVTFIMYADGVEVFRKNVTSPNPFRLPSGYKAREFEFQLSGTAFVRNLKVAESVAELKVV